MKKVSKLLALLLTVAMLASVMCLPAFADGEYDRYASLKEGTGYVSLGDSFARGYGASDHFLNQIYKLDDTNDPYGRNVDGSYPNLVAKAFGLYSPDDIRDTSAKMWNLSKDAVSVSYMLDLLGIDDNYRDEFLYEYYPIMSTRYSTDLYYFGDEQSYNVEGTGTYGKDGTVKSVRDLLDNASLISVGLGQADVVYKAQTLYFNTIDLSDTENLPSALATLISKLYEYYDYWKEAYPLLLDYIKENNPDATVVLVGTMNPIQNALISDDVLVPVGGALTIIMDLMNKVTKELAEEYGYIYIDITNVETPSTEQDLTLSYIMSLQGTESGLQAHPTPNGYAQIARMIVAAVEKTLPAEPDTPVVPETPKTFISVDLGRFQSVDSVVVDGKTIDNYTMDGYVLTVPNYTTDAKTLMVTIVGEDGKITVMTYSLSYDNGYTATRVYQTNDAEKTATNVFTKIANAFKTAWNKFVGLFKK